MCLEPGEVIRDCRSRQIKGEYRCTGVQQRRDPDRAQLAQGARYDGYFIF
jgi:hypothetical protein